MYVDMYSGREGREPEDHAMIYIHINVEGALKHVEPATHPEFL